MDALKAKKHAVKRKEKGGSSKLTLYEQNALRREREAAQQTLRRETKRAISRYLGINFPYNTY